MPSAGSGGLSDACLADVTTPGTCSKSESSEEPECRVFQTRLSQRKHGHAMQNPTYGFCE